jgi:hypothetical protein
MGKISWRISHETTAVMTFFIKHAAKAVKRISQKEFKEVADETLAELLGIATEELGKWNYRAVPLKHRRGLP